MSVRNTLRLDTFTENGPTSQDNPDDLVEENQANTGAETNTGPETVVGRYLRKIQQELQKELQMLKQKQTTIHWKFVKTIMAGDFYVDPANPVISMMTAKQATPDGFYLPKVFLWFPSIAFPWVEFKCPDCDLPMTRKGMPEPRRVYGLESSYYIFQERMYCSSCRSNPVVTSQDIHQQCPPEVLGQFPCLLTHRAAVDLKLVDLIMASVGNKLGPDALSKIILEMYSLRYFHDMIKYYSTLLSRKKQGKIDEVIHFSEFKDPGKYNGVSPSCNII